MRQAGTVLVPWPWRTPCSPSAPRPISGVARASRSPSPTCSSGPAARPVVRGDQVTITTTMTLTLSIDHRAVDGAAAARFLTRLRELIEQPLDIVP